jgi:predicted dehydrogenase
MDRSPSCAVLPAGKPVVFDKLLADRVEDARLIIEQAAEHGAPIFSSSALRYAAELADVERTRHAQVGPHQLDFFGAPDVAAGNELR